MGRNEGILEEPMPSLGSSPGRSITIAPLGFHSLRNTLCCHLITPHGIGHQPPFLGWGWGGCSCYVSVSTALNNHLIPYHQQLNFRHPFDHLFVLHSSPLSTALPESPFSPNFSYLQKIPDLNSFTLVQLAEMPPVKPFPLLL